MINVKIILRCKASIHENYKLRNIEENLPFKINVQINLNLHEDTILFAKGPPIKKKEKKK